MGSVTSPVPAIAATRFHQLKSGVTANIKRMVLHGGYVFIEKTDGSIETNHPIGGNRYVGCTPATWPPIRALRLLGRITSAEANTHGRLAAEHEAKEKASWAARKAEEYLAGVGIRLTPAQARRLRQLRKQLKLARVTSTPEGGTRE